MANIIILMGVSGSGKTTIGQKLAETLGWQFRDADDYHSAENKIKMQRGEPLSDQDRQPWLASLQEATKAWHSNQTSTVLACSALKSSYREQLAAEHVLIDWVYLEGHFSTIQARLQQHFGHFMSPDLLQSQFEILEIEPNIPTVSIEDPPDIIVTRIQEIFSQARRSDKRQPFSGE